MNETDDLFKIEPKPLSELEVDLITDSMEGLVKLNENESKAHVKQAYKAYFDQLKNLLVEYKPDGNKI